MMKKIGQATIEFTFAMVMIALLIFGLIKIFHWAGMDYAQKAYMQDTSTVFDTSPGKMTNLDPESRRQRVVAYTHNY